MVQSSGITAEELAAMTIAELKQYAKDNGYTIKATKKAEIIAEILEQANK